MHTVKAYVPPFRPAPAQVFPGAYPFGRAPTPIVDGSTSFDPGVSSSRARRVLNVFVALVALVLVAPIMAIIAVLVKLSSSGPVLYTQMRVGVDRRTGGPPPPGCRRTVDYGGRIFKIYKFRTMYTDSEAAGQVWASPEDPRVTPIGRVLRKYRLDELPQLINVVKGDMNLVGPRPEQPEIFRELRNAIDGYPMRQRVLPGITGWAQVNQHYDSSIEDVRRKLHLDIEYMKRESVLEDIRIMMRTVPVVVFQQGAW